MDWFSNIAPTCARIESFGRVGNASKKNGFASGFALQGWPCWLSKAQYSSSSTVENLPLPSRATGAAGSAGNPRRGLESAASTARGVGGPRPGGASSSAGGASPSADSTGASAGGFFFLRRGFLRGFAGCSVSIGVSSWTSAISSSSDASGSSPRRLWRDIGVPLAAVSSSSVRRSSESTLRVRSESLRRRKACDPRIHGR
mmetsp:Transcript_907/g.2700  ORF Transcript_907/g.2700 Transcript_907/m.2700 type:complete len:201 (-) Transcript_907:83-685(-)